MLKKISILILVILIVGCGSEFDRNGKFSGDFRVTDPSGKSLNGDLVFEGNGTMTLEGTHNPEFKLEEPVLKLGKDTPLPDCVIFIAKSSEEFDEMTHAFTGTREYRNLKEGKTPQTADGAPCRGKFSKDEPPTEVEIKGVYVKAHKNSSFEYEVEINFQAVGDYKKERWIHLFGNKTWF